MSDFVDEYSAASRRPQCLAEACSIIVKHAFFIEVFSNARIAMEGKLSYYNEKLPKVLADFGITE